MKSVCVSFCLLLGCLTAQAAKFSHPTVDQIVTADVTPEGVVFELAAWGDDSWDWAAPMLQDLVGQLREHYPELEIALVSHGFELFDLSHRSGKAERASIKLLEKIARDRVDIHVCGSYAATRFYQATDFLPFVNVAASGDAQLEDYLRLGFTRVVLDPPDGFD